MIKRQQQPLAQDQQKQARHTAYLEKMRADWGSRKISYKGPLLSIGSYLPAQDKLSVVSTAGPLLFLPKSMQAVVLDIDDEGWARLIVGFDRLDQPVYRYAKIETLQHYASLIDN